MVNSLCKEEVAKLFFISPIHTCSCGCSIINGNGENNCKVFRSPFSKETVRFSDPTISSMVYITGSKPNSRTIRQEREKDKVVSTLSEDCLYFLLTLKLDAVTLW